MRDLMEFQGLHVRRDHFHGVGLLGFSFACEWDEEHGLGVLTHRSRIIDVRQAKVATSEPTKASSMWLPICTARERAAAIDVMKAIAKASRRRRQASGAPRRGEREAAMAPPHDSPLLTDDEGYRYFIAELDAFKVLGENLDDLRRRIDPMMRAWFRLPEEAPSPLVGDKSDVSKLAHGPA